MLRVGPGLHRSEAGAGEERLRFAGGELVAVLGVDGLIRAEMNAEPESGDGDALGAAADKMHFNARGSAVPDGTMLECFEIELGAELAVQPLKQIQIEGCGDAFGVVVSGDERGYILAQIDAEQESVAGIEMRANAPQKSGGVGGLKVADARADEEDEAALAVITRLKIELAGEVHGMRPETDAGQ